MSIACVRRSLGLTGSQWLIHINASLGTGTDSSARVGAMNATSVPGAHPRSMTIGRLAKAAQVGVETIRYYQGRGLLPVPRATGAVRHYPSDLVDRIGFIKRAQGLGFSLQEISTLLDLADGRNRRAVQAVAKARLEQIRAKLADLTRMRQTLDELLDRCLTTGRTHPCPIVEALMGLPQSH